MSSTEQQAIREKYYAEALRYMDNAKDTLKKANKEDRYYHNQKYVRTACGAAGLVNRVYDVLHLGGYYDGIRDAGVIKTGFDIAYSIIEKINPLQAS